ncbi:MULTISPECIES: ATP-binding protein [Pseudomonas]|uniref:Sensory/regulatory protein RpfC n=1 Tax=Pseudomonas asplenii TaxID=53407 RepID=A0A0N0VIK3_9PSED|nr:MULTISPECIES: ATP-binding protein [Pseudomonas]KPA87712.1 signal transduction histidine kinase [Pseudomonas fuscovaginae]KPA97800.1 signal transduction histidine kinase [Pseudomonas fuscovaginae]
MFKVRRKIGILLLVYVVGVSGYIYYLHAQAQRILTDSINNKLLHAALGGAAILGDRYHNDLVDRHSKSEAEDLDAIRKLSRFNESMGTAFVYTVIKRGGEAILVSSSASAKEVQENNFVRFFDPYPDASQTLLDSFDQTGPSWIDYTDHWGDFRAVFVPMKSQDGTPYVAGAEITLADYYHELNQDSLHHIVLAILVFLSFSLLFVIDALRMRTHLRQLQTNEQVLKQAKIAAEEADRMKSQFLATMSHEIRTPMYGVIGATDLLWATPLTAQQSDLLGTIHTSGKTLLALIDDILDLAKIESGKLDLRPRVFELHSLVASSVEMVRQNLRDKPVTLEVTVFPQVPNLVKTDPDRLRQILINLLGNAIKFTETGEVSLTVSLGDSESPPRLNFSIRDTGVGIPAERHGSLFKPFTQFEGANNQRFTGSGLGLSICKNLIEAQGGILSFSSLFGVGSTFAFSLPIEPFSEQEIPVAGEHPALEFDASFARHYPLDILLVENHELNQKVATAMLQTLGYEPDLACDGLEALDRCRRALPAVILMDINMPGMDGMEAIRRIRELPLGDRCYIVAFTASAFSNEIEHFRAAGANDILTKPASFQGFADVLRRSADHRAQFEVSAPVVEGA